MHPALQLAALLLAALLLAPAGVQAHPGADAHLHDTAAALRSDPCDIDALLRRGRALHGDERFEEARAVYEQAGRCSPGEPEVGLGLGLVYEAAGQPARAIPFLTRFLETEGAHAGALLTRARASESMGALDDAVADLRRATELMPRPIPDHVLKLAGLLSTTGHPTEARAVLDAALEQLGPIKSLQRLLATLPPEAP